MGYARAGHRCAMERVVALAALPTVSTRTGPHWLAVRSGADSNDLNAVVSKRGFVPDHALLEGLRAWWNGAPASWLVEDPDEALTHVLINAGWTPERTGRFCGRRLGHSPQEPNARVHRRAKLETVCDDNLEQWLDIATECGWITDLEDRLVRRKLLSAAAGDPRHEMWLARLGKRPVGMARGWWSGPTVEVVDVAVLDSARRCGVATSLVSGVVVWGATHRAREVVAAPSPDGWRLFDALGFENVPVTHDACFYWTG